MYINNVPTLLYKESQTNIILTTNYNYSIVTNTSNNYCQCILTLRTLVIDLL